MEEFVPENHPHLIALFDRQQLLESDGYRQELHKLQLSLVHKAAELLRTLAFDPLNIAPVHDAYKQILLNLYHLLGKLRQGQAYEQVKAGLKRDIDTKRALHKQLQETLEGVHSQLETL